MISVTRRPPMLPCVPPPSTFFFPPTRVCRRPARVGSRVEQLEDWISARPEKVIAVVGHGGLFSRFLGHHLKNCGWQWVRRPPPPLPPLAAPVLEAVEYLLPQVDWDDKSAAGKKAMV